MNERIKELYVEFHTKRRLRVERLTEERFQYYIAEGCNNSPAIHKDALYWAMEQISEEEQFSDFAELIVKECIDMCDEVKYHIEQEFIDPEFGPTECINLIKNHFGLEE